MQHDTIAVVILSNTFYSRAAVAQVSSAFKELQPLVKGRKTPTDILVFLVGGWSWR